MKLISFVYLVILFSIINLVGGADYGPIEMREGANITLDNGYIKNLPDGLDAGDAMTMRQKLALNLKSYGAVGDGLANDSVAFSNCLLDSVADSLPIYIPPGTYYIPVVHIIEHDGFTIFGSDRFSSILYSNQSNYILQFGNGTAAHGAHISDLWFDGDEDRSAKGINFAKGAYIETVERCQFTDLEYGIYASNSASLTWSPKITECHISDCKYGILFDIGVWQGAIQNCYIHDITDGWAVKIGNSGYPTGALSFIGNTIERNSGLGGVWLINCRAAKVQSCYFEGNNFSSIYITGSGQAITIADSYFNLGAYPTQYGNAVNNADGSIVVGPGNAFSGYGPAYYAITTGPSSITRLNMYYSTPNSTYLYGGSGSNRMTYLYSAEHQAKFVPSTIAALCNDLNATLIKLEASGIMKQS